DMSYHHHSFVSSARHFNVSGDILLIPSFSIKKLNLYLGKGLDDIHNGEALRKCILSGPYKPTTVLVQAVEATDDSPTIPEHTTIETPMNMSPENKAHFLAEKEAIHLILTGIGDEIYSTVDAFQIAQEMWEAIERLQQGESLNIQDVKTNFRHKGKEIAKPITPQSETTSKEDSDPEQAQRDKDMQNNLALITKYFKKIYKPTNNNLRTPSNSKNKNVDTTLCDPEQAQRDKDMQNNLALITKYFKKIYKPTNNNLRTSSNSKNKNVDTTLWEFGHFAKECIKPKRVKDFAYHKEKMLLCKKAKQCVLLQAE
nr:hypothetical protein [Tanacetum cinerariifolium]